MTEDSPPIDGDVSTAEDSPAKSDTTGDSAGSGDALGTAGGTLKDEQLLGEVFFADLQRKLTLAAVAVLALLAAFAIYRAYAATSQAIAIWFSRDFVPIFAAIFNVVVFLVAVAGIFYLVRRVAQ